MTEPTELLPCPFCGSKAFAGVNKGESLWSHNIVDWTRVHCTNDDCNAQTEPTCEGYEPSAIEVWNRRTPQPTQAQAWPPKSWIDEVRGYLTAAADSSMSRNNSEQLASELLEQMPTQAQAGAVPTREFLERTLAAMEGVIDVADRKTDEFDALRSCVIDLTLMLFKPGQHSTTQPVAVPLTDNELVRRSRVGAIQTDENGKVVMWPAYYRTQMEDRFKRGWREAEKHHGIKGGQHGSDT